MRRLLDNQFFRALARAVMLMFVCSFLYSSSSNRSELFEVKRFGSNPGNLEMFVYVPPRMPLGRRPLLIALHGCFGSADQYMNAGWDQLARSRKFLVLYPQQKQENHPSKCFNLFLPDEPQKAISEILSIRQMIDKMLSKYRIDRSRIFVTGFSSGGYMALTLGASYPQLFAGVAMTGAGPYRCERGHFGIKNFVRCPSQTSLPARPNFDASLACDPSPEGAAYCNKIKRFFRRNKTARRPEVIRWPRVTIWHGAQDKNVEPEKMELAAEQWAKAHGIDTVPDVTKRIGGDIVYKAYMNKQRRTLIETYYFENMAHSIAVNPASGCGSVADEYFSVEKICFARLSAQFFGL